jgi:hypothetical protein
MSGLAQLDINTLQFNSFELDYDGTCRHLALMGHHYGNRLRIVAEAFFITPETHKLSFQPWSLELIGVSRFVSRAYTGCELVTQAKSNVRNKLGTDARLKKLGWYRWTPDGHANDAAGHLLAFAADNNFLPQSILEQLVDTFD